LRGRLPPATGRRDVTTQKRALRNCYPRRAIGPNFVSCTPGENTVYKISIGSSPPNEWKSCRARSMYNSAQNLHFAMTPSKHLSIHSPLFLALPSFPLLAPFKPSRVTRLHTLRHANHAVEHQLTPMNASRLNLFGVFSLFRGSTRAPLRTPNPTRSDPKKIYLFARPSGSLSPGRGPGRRAKGLCELNHLPCREFGSDRPLPLRWSRLLDSTVLFLCVPRPKVVV